MVRVYSSRWGTLLARALPYLPSPFQRLALGEIYGGPDRVADSSLHEIVEGLRNPGTLRHVLAIIRTWFAEMATLKRALHRIARIPTLLIWGDQDCTVSLTSGLRLKRKLRGSRFVTVPGAGHSVFEQFPEQANHILLDWLDQHPLPEYVPSAQPATTTARSSSPRRRARFARTAAVPMRSLSPGT
jgi:pimeloyl-ACP methyl ester carboxylesterase